MVLVRDELAAARERLLSEAGMGSFYFSGLMRIGSLFHYTYCRYIGTYLFYTGDRLLISRQPSNCHGHVTLFVSAVGITASSCTHVSYLQSKS